MFMRDVKNTPVNHKESATTVNPSKCVIGTDSKPYFKPKVYYSFINSTLIEILTFEQAVLFINSVCRAYDIGKNEIVDTAVYEVSEGLKIGDIWLEIGKYCDFILPMAIDEFHDFCKEKGCHFTKAIGIADADNNLIRKLWVATDIQMRKLII